MTARELKRAKPGDRIMFKAGCYKGLTATITVIDPPGPKGQSRLEYEMRSGRQGAVFSHRVNLLPA